MRGNKLAWIGVGLLVMILSAGCNPLAVPVFLFGPEPKRPAMYQSLVPEDEKEAEKAKTIKVAILAYGNLETRPEFMQADRELSLLVARFLQEACTYNKEKVKVIDSRKIEEFKNSHPDWKQLDPAEIGKAVKADAVIVMELGKMSLHEGANETMYRGRAEIGLSLVRVKDSEDAPALPPRNLICTYPGETKGGFIMADLDKTPEAFKADFFNVIGRKVAWHFTAHPTSQDYLCE